MIGIYLNHPLSDKQRRELLFKGELLLYSRSAASAALCGHAAGMAEEAFGPLDPQTAQHHLPVEKFIEIAGPLKSRFTNDLRTKELVRGVLEEYGCDLKRTYFDVPRLRVVTSDGYLAAGVGYAYKAHRDNWYSSPDAQINWWTPVYNVEPRRSMNFYPEYWDKAIGNSSADFDYEEWKNVGRKQAAGMTGVDTRKHPVPTEEIVSPGAFRFAGTTADLLLFSTAHLHATALNDTGVTRFSMDFRTVSLDDIEAEAGAPNLDNRATSTTLGDFICADDFAPIDPAYVAKAQAIAKAAHAALAA